MANTITHRPGEEVTYTHSFAEMDEIVAGETIASVTSVVAVRTSGSGSDTLTIGSETVNADADGVEFEATGGTHDHKYIITTTVVLSGGSIRKGKMPFHVTNQSQGRVA